MHNLLKGHYSNKQGCGCAMCKPHKHNGADHRTRHDIQADISTHQQMAEWEEAQAEAQNASRSLVTARPS